MSTASVSPAEERKEMRDHMLYKVDINTISSLLFSSSSFFLRIAINSTCASCNGTMEHNRIGSHLHTTQHHIPDISIESYM